MRFFYIKFRLRNYELKILAKKEKKCEGVKNETKKKKQRKQREEKRGRKRRGVIVC